MDHPVAYRQPLREVQQPQWQPPQQQQQLPPPMPSPYTDTVNCNANYSVNYNAVLKDKTVHLTAL
jgi:hypothetical protein